MLGCGIDVPYPNRRLIERIRTSGTVVTEFAPGTPPEPRRFPARNRIVAGLAGATVVVEGADGSGSMITAEHAMEFGRDVYAMPGAVNNPLSFVPLQLIREGATMIRGPEDLLNDLGIEPASGSVDDPGVLSGPERRALDELTGPTLPERVAAALGTGVPETVALLMGLEVRGFVRSVGGRFEPTLRGSTLAPGSPGPHPVGGGRPLAISRSARGTPDEETRRTGIPARARRLAAIEER